MHPTDYEKMQFITNEGLYCFRVMPFKFKNIKSSYQRIFECVFKEHNERIVEIYVDDICHFEKVQ